MTRVVVDPATLAHIRDVCQPVELCDASGRVIGHFIPVLSSAPSPEMLPAISEEELDRRQQARGGRPLTAILDDLEKRA